MTNELINIGYDPGRHTCKNYMDGDKEYINLNVISNGYDRRELEEEASDEKNLLDVQVSRADQKLGRYFVGGMAYKYHDGDLRWSTRAIPKFADIDTVPDDIINMVTHIAYNHHVKGQKVTIRIRLGTGVPTEDYFERPEVLDHFRNMIKDPYTVKFLHSIFQDAEVTVHFAQVYFKPEGAATLISNCYDNTLKLRDHVKANKEKRTLALGLNIGSTTSDAAIMKPNMKFDSKGFFGLPIGTTDAFKKIRMEIEKNFAYRLNNFKLAHLLQNYKTIMYRQRVIDLEEIKKGPLESLLASLKTQYLDKCEEKGIDLGEAGYISIAGGGVLDLGAKKLENFIPGIPTIVDPNPLMADARGYWLECKFAELQEIKVKNEVFDSKEEGVG